MDEIEFRKLERQVQRLRFGCRVQSIALLTCILGILVLVGRRVDKPESVLASTTDRDGNLHVRGLIVEDENGHERVRLGAPLPDPIIHGVRYKRQAAISGLNIYDADGNERGGIVTSDKYGEAFLALDSETQQQVLFLVNPKGGANLDLFDGAVNEANLTVFPKGPHFVMKRRNEMVTELPLATK